LLQEQVGLPLVERSPAGMTPTEAGCVLREAVRRIEAILADADAALGSLAGAKGGTVRMGVVSTAKYFAPRIIGAFARAHPGVELKFVVGNRAEIVRGLQEHDLDLAVMGRPPEDLEVSASVLSDHPHVVVVAPDHRLAGRRAVPPASLSGEIFLVREPGSGTRILMERFFADSGIAPKIGMEIGSNETVKQAVIAGLGVAFLSAHTIELEVQARRLMIADIEGLPIVRQWFVVRLSGRRLMPAADLLARFLIEEGRVYVPRIALRPYD